MSQNYSPSGNSSIGKNLPLFNADVIKSISDTVQFTLLKNAGSWVMKGYVDVDDFIQSANLHILNRSDAYDPDHGTSFKSWACVVAKNYTISESKKLKKIITAKTRFDMIEGMDFEDFSVLEPFQKKEEYSESLDRLAQNHYESLGYASPMIFLGKKYYTEETPIYPLLVDLQERGKYKNLILGITDDTNEVIRRLMDFHRPSGYYTQDCK